jgi:hypothetical protein
MDDDWMLTNLTQVLGSVNWHGQKNLKYYIYIYIYIQINDG